MKTTRALAVFALSALTTVAVTLPSKAMALFSRNVQANACLPARGATGIASDGGYLSNTGASSASINCALPDDTNLPAASATLVNGFFYDGSTTDRIQAVACSIANNSSVASCGSSFTQPVSFLGFTNSGPGLSAINAAAATDYKYLHVTLPANSVSASFFLGFTIQG